nr:retrovirus-related Pol polyprotein from transposon TNT 1-94 [Tanacetum cinerariifolium]
VIPPTSVSRPQLKSNQMEDRVMLNNNQGKKHEVEDHRKNVKFSNNKMFVTACNDSLNAKTSNGVARALAARDADRNTNDDDSHNSGTGARRTKRVARKCTYPDFIKWKPLNFKGTEGVVGLSQWFEKMESVYSISNCTVACQVKFSTCTLGEIKKLEFEMWNLKVKGTDVVANSQRFQELALMCDRMFLEEIEKLVEIILLIVDSGCSKHMTGNLKLLTNFVEKFLGSRGTDLYSITLQDTSSPNPICLMAKATSSQAWLWHHRLSHLNFDTINLLSKNDIVTGLPKLKFIKDHLCSSCELGKAKRKSFQTKTTPSSKRRLQLLHMDLCGPMWVESINGNKYVLVIVDDYSRYTWNHFLRSKDETPEVLIDFLRPVQRGLHAQVRIVRTEKGTEFLNKTLLAYFASEGIQHQTVRDGENLDKMKEKGDACIFVGYSTQSRAYMVFNKRTSVIVKTIHVNFDELPQMASDHFSSDPVPQCQSTALEHDSLSPGPQSQANVPIAAGTVTTSNKLDLLFSLMFDELLNGSTQVVSKSSTVTTGDAPKQCQQQHTTPLNTQTTHEPTCLDPTQAPTVTSTENINQAETITKNAQVEDDEFINIFCTSVQDRGETSSFGQININEY